MADVEAIHKENKGRYGAFEIHALLEQEYCSCSLKRVQRLIKETGIQSTITKK